LTTLWLSVKEKYVRITKRIPLLQGIVKNLGPFVPLVLLWSFISYLRIWPDYLFPSPWQVVETGIDLFEKGIMQKNIWVSLIRLLSGFLVGAVGGIVLAFLMGVNRSVNKFFDPLINFFQSIAGIAWVPLALIWFGFGMKTIIFVIVNTVFFPVIFNTLMGIRSVPIVMEEAVMTLGADRKRVIFEVLLPGALPSIMTGLRVGMGYGWRSLIAAEMISSDTGLGFMIFDAKAYFLTDVVILGMLTIGVIWMIIDRLCLRPVERKTIERWGLVR
jgi:taurine transport system permease protein